MPTNERTKDVKYEEHIRRSSVSSSSCPNCAHSISTWTPSGSTSKTKMKITHTVTRSIKINTTTFTSTSTSQCHHYGTQHSYPINTHPCPCQCPHSSSTITSIGITITLTRPHNTTRPMYPDYLLHVYPSSLSPPTLILHPRQHYQRRLLWPFHEPEMAGGTFVVNKPCL